MKNIRILFLLLLISLCRDIIATQLQQPQKKQRSWYQSFHIADYLPEFIGKIITRRRVERMFEGTEQYIQRFLKESPSWKKEDEAIAFINEYNQWIDQFYDIIDVKIPLNIGNDEDEEGDEDDSLDEEELFSVADLWVIRLQNVRSSDIVPPFFLYLIINNLEAIGGRSDIIDYLTY